MRGYDSNPRTPMGPNHKSAIVFYDRDREKWFKWAKKEAPSSVGDYKNKLDKYLQGKKINTPEEFRELTESIPLTKSGKPNRHAYNAIANYIRFLEKTGKVRRGQAMDFRAVIPTIKTESRSEVEKAVTEEDIIKAYNDIAGKGLIKKARQLAFKLLLFTELRGIVLYLMKNFDPSVIEKSYLAFGIPEDYKTKVAIYDLKTFKVHSRKHDTKRGYVAIFPKELVSDLTEITSKLKIDRFVIRKDRMFRNPKNVIDLALLRKYHYNFFNDHALRVPDIPADVYRIIEFMQGRTHKTVGGQSYRANVQTAVRLYYYLIDLFKEKVNIIQQ